MQHTAGLSSRDANWLANTFARNHALFADWSMEATDDKPKPGDGDKGTDDKPKPDVGKGGAGGSDADGKSDDDKPLGANGEKALKAERDERKKLETELTDLKKGLATALGLGGDDGKDDTTDALAKIQERLDAMQHENTVLAVANEHRITEKADLELLATIKDAEAMKKLAERLAPAEGDAGAKPGRPKPDRGQGGGGSSSGTSSGKSVREVMEERRAAREARSTTK